MHHRHRRLIICRILGGAIGIANFLGLVGCGEESGRAFKPEMSASAPTIANRTYQDASVAPASAPPGEQGQVPSKAAAETAEKAEEKKPQLPRKINYNADVMLVVESIVDFGRKLGDLVKQSRGYVSKTDQTSYAGARRGATWTIRVPVEKFEGLLATLGRMGEMQQSHLDSQDVSQEYYDIEARIANKQLEEKRLLKHLADSTGKLEDILAVERELSRVRGEIEQMQGRIRYLSNVTAYSTVTINASELVDFTPPVRPTFGTQIGRTFRDSVDALVTVAKDFVLFSVAVAPWLPILILLALPILWRIRKKRGRRTTSEGS